MVCANAVLALPHQAVIDLVCFIVIHLLREVNSSRQIANWIDMPEKSRFWQVRAKLPITPFSGKHSITSQNPTSPDSLICQRRLFVESLGD
jgi:hypothetical protein